MARNGKKKLQYLIILGLISFIRLHDSNNIQSAKLSWSMLPKIIQIILIAFC